MQAHRLHARTKSTSGPSCMQMLKDIGHPYAEGEAGLRRHLRERAGGRAHQPSVSPRQPARRAGRRHRRPERAGARLVHLRRRRPHVALQRQRQRAQDADPAPHPMGRADRTARRQTQRRRCSKSWRRRSAPSWFPAATADGAPGAGHRGDDRPVRAAGLQPLLHAALRLSAAQGRVPGVLRVARHARAANGPTSRRATATSTTSPRSRGHLRTFLYRFFQTSQFKRSAIPNAPKVGSGGSLSPRGDWRAPSDSEAAAWLAALDLVPDRE